MPWGHPGEHHDFEPQRHDDGYLEVIGFTMTSLVSGPAWGVEPPSTLYSAQHSSKMGRECHQTSLLCWALTVSSL